MSREPEDANRYLVTAFSVTRGRWITDTTGNKELALMWADDWRRCPDRYSRVTLQDLMTRQRLSLPALPVAAPSEGMRPGDDDIVLFHEAKHVAVLGSKAVDVVGARWQRICNLLDNLHPFPMGSGAKGWVLVDDPNLSAPTMPEKRPDEPESLRRTTGHQTRLAVLWHGKDWEEEPVLPAPAPYPSTFKAARLPGIGIVVVDPHRSEVMMPGMRREDLGVIMQARILHALRNLPLGGFGEPITVVDDVILTRKEIA